MRTQLYEGKDFAEKYVQMLMDTQFTIKDKEEKVDKIFGIIGEIQTELDKILVFKPFTPLELQKMKSDEARKDTESSSFVNPQEQPTPAPLSSRKQVSSSSK